MTLIRRHRFLLWNTTTPSTRTGKINHVSKDYRRRTFLSMWKKSVTSNFLTTWPLNLNMHFYEAEDINTTPASQSHTTPHRPHTLYMLRSYSKMHKKFVPFPVWSLFYWHGLTLIPAWVSDQIPSRLRGMKLLKWHPLHTVGWNYLSIPKLQRLHRWSLGMDKSLHLTLCNGCNSSSMPHSLP